MSSTPPPSPSNQSPRSFSVRGCLLNFLTTFLAIVAAGFTLFILTQDGDPYAYVVQRATKSLVDSSVSSAIQASKTIQQNTHCEASFSIMSQEQFVQGVTENDGLDNNKANLQKRLVNVVPLEYVDGKLVKSMLVYEECSLLKIHCNAWDCFATAEQNSDWRTLQFSGYTWKVKRGRNLAAADMPSFSDHPEAIWVDADGYLHLRIIEQNNEWHCTEAYTNASFGYGDYEFIVSTSLEQLDPNAILRLSSAAIERVNQSTSIEFSTTDGLTAQFVATNYDRQSFVVNLQGADFMNRFTWQPDAIQFMSQPSTLTSMEPITWRSSGNGLPYVSTRQAQISLCLLQNSAPANQTIVEVIIKSFKFS